MGRRRKARQSTRRYSHLALGRLSEYPSLVRHMTMPRRDASETSRSAALGGTLVLVPLMTMTMFYLHLVSDAGAQAPSETD